LVVFGGSQGAQFFASAVPTALSLLDPAERERLVVTQQARPEDQGRVNSCFAKLKAPVDVSPFFSDMAERLAMAHLVICRSGASTVSEISVIGRPSILVPYPYALDHDQAANAAALVATGGAQVVPQSELSPDRLSAMISAAIKEPERLEKMAAAAKQAGRPDAANALADLVICVAERRPISEYKGVRA
jgi:UDP-N-acetylglucosamine--N-acetylmuramyl-(pentapeptide) pyrophosphoryl-undecaprenol N-acetylglucosamine transferase